MRQIRARSVSRSVHAGLISEAGAAWQVLAVFDHACDLVTPRGDVMAIVLPAIGDGPLNVVVEEKPGTFADLKPGIAAVRHGSQIHVAEMHMDMGQAKIWEPRPDWERLRANGERIQKRFPQLARLALQHSPGTSLLDDLFAARGEPDSQSPDGAGRAAFQRALADLRAGWSGDGDRLRRGAAQLAGLGSGLTPAGDDFLTGFMLRGWLQHPDPRSFCLELVQVAAPRTTILSAALLRAAAHGECSASWHALLTALDAAGEDLGPKAADVLSYGHTSGADTLAGLLFYEMA